MRHVSRLGTALGPFGPLLPIKPLRWVLEYSGNSKFWLVQRHDGQIVTFTSTGLIRARSASSGRWRQRSLEKKWREMASRPTLGLYDP